MNKMILALVLLPIGLVSCKVRSHVNKTKNNRVMQVTKEEEGILRAIDLYVDAGRKADSKIAAPAFAETATMSWTENGELKSVPIQALYDLWDKGEPTEASYELTYCNVAQDAAIVRIESQFGASKYADMFTLVKDGNNWKIVSKIYHVK